ncbi:MAG: serine hydrolase [Candidatus Falkowbacteria bacterium]|nr:serine hydrolase [Candidatus Falkowbacteria bacterium]
MKKILVSLILVSLTAATSPIIWAQDVISSGDISYSFEASIGSSSLSQDLSFSAFENHLQIGIPAGRLTAPTIVSLRTVNEVAVPPSGLNQAGYIYQVDIPAANFSQGSYYLSLRSSGSNFSKQVYFFDTNKNAWQKLPSNENFIKGTVNTTLTMPFARLAIFENPKILVKGSASWYRFKNGLFAASPDFPKGTKLRVINLDNKKSVDVIINDYGPDRSKLPNRVVDLDAVAFAKLAPTSQGMMNNIAVEELPANTVITPVKEKTDDTVSAVSALAFNSADKKILWSKEPNKVVSMASLTKLIAVKVFLDTKPDLKKVVAYSVKDEQLNNLYVPASQSARLKLKDGDKVTIKDLVASSLIGSTNNTVESLVRVSGVKRETFIARMNAKLKAWGATKTSVVEPTGLSQKNVTTARDYAIIAREAFSDATISSLTVKQSYTVTTFNSKIKHSFKNTNLLAREADSDLLGSKTGYLDEAGYCLATKWPSDKNKNIIVVVFGAPTRQASVDDTKTLLALANKTLK